MKMTTNTEARILERLDQMLRLIAIQVASDKSITERARLLKLAGLRQLYHSGRFEHKQRSCCRLDVQPQEEIIAAIISEEGEPTVKPTDRSERLLALLLMEQMKGATQAAKVLKLNLGGFSNVEIADILQMTSFQVAQALYVARKAPGSKQKKKTQKAE